MKRADLQAGQEYLYSTSNDWNNPRYGDGGGQRVLVIDTQGWDRRNRRLRDDRPVPTVTLPDGREVENVHALHSGTYGRADGVLVIGMPGDGSRAG